LHCGRWRRRTRLSCKRNERHWLGTIDRLRPNVLLAPAISPLWG
jgi:hypothetical protein